MINDEMEARRCANPERDPAAVVRTALTDPDGLSADAQERLELWSDPLIDLVARHERLHASSPAFDDPRFLEWVSRDARAGVGAAPEALTKREIKSLARLVIARAQGTRHRVASAGDKFRYIHAGPTGRVSELVAEARGLRRSPVLGLSAAAGVGRELWDIETDTWVELPAAVPGGRYVALTVAGDSMIPLFYPADLVLVRVGGEIERQSIIVAHIPDHGYVVKAVSRVTPILVELTSLNQEYPPLRVARGELAVLGTVILRWQGAPRPPA